MGSKARRSTGLTTSIVSKTTQGTTVDTRFFSKDYIGLETKQLENFIISITNSAKTLLSDFTYEDADGIAQAPGDSGDGSNPPSISVAPSRPLTVSQVLSGQSGLSETQLIEGSENLEKMTDSEIQNVKNYKNYSENYLNVFSSLINKYKNLSNYADYVNSFSVTYDGNGNPKVSLQIDIDDTILPLVTDNNGATINYKWEKIL